jgi:predicted O-methyltransferase YrrM
MIPLRLPPPGRRRSGVISVTMPSRGRHARMAASLDSLRDTAARPDLLEFLVAYDPDDPVTGRLARERGACTWEAPRRYGFTGQSLYYAALLELADGEWLLPSWSDDGLMQTPGWDEKLRALPAGSVAYLDGNYPGLTCFPAVHADALGAIGRLSPLPSLDTWFEESGRDAGVLELPGIYVHQDRPDLTGCPPDQTYLEGGGAWRAGPGATASQAYYRDPYAEWRAEDTAALHRHRELEDDYAARLVPWSDVQEQAPLLRAAARRYAAPAVAELGTRTGESTAAFLAGVSASGGHVWSVDCGPCTSQWQGSPLWSFLAADDMSDEAAAWLPDELDILFIDTSHLYAHTLAELRKYVPRVRPGGLVLCHDTDIGREFMLGYGEIRAAGDPDYPVAAALDAFCAEAGLSWSRQVRPENPPAPDRPFSGLGTITIPAARERPAP